MISLDRPKADAQNLGDVCLGVALRLLAWLAVPIPACTAHADRFPWFRFCLAICPRKMVHCGGELRRAQGGWGWSDIATRSPGRTRRTPRVRTAVRHHPIRGQMAPVFWAFGMSFSYRGTILS